MNRRLPWILLLTLATAAHAANVPPPAPLAPTEAHATAARASAKLLGRYHYQAPVLDDAMSASIFERYLKDLDPDKVYFLQSDIDDFASARTTLDDAIIEGRLELPFAIFERYRQRVQERLTGARALLAKGFDFTIDESYRHIRTDAPWAASVAELDEIWRKRVKNDWLRLRLAGKDDKAIRETLEKRYQQIQARSARYKSDDVFQIFMNAYANTTDPHTSYLGPKASEDFAINMKLSLVGIGAVLQERDDYITIRELVPGGPAARSGKLNVGDRIIAVTQSDGATAEVLGWRVDDVVSLIRGTKGSTVVLDTLPADAAVDASPQRVSLVRDTINLEKQAASKSIIEVAGNGAAPRRVGVITLPTFYQDSEGRQRGKDDYRSATRDVARLLEELKAEKVDAVLMDLRNNGGGSLDEAIQLTGLFIDQGPVVQQRNAEGKVRVERDNKPGMVWEGPLGVMINRASASASEIFAAAIQDYGRGVVIGEPSFGKGTVQSLIDLDDIARSEKPRYGELKLTIAQFFRVNGGTTQLRGVAPDLPLLMTSDPTAFGESSFDNALPWAQIGAADFARTGNPADLLPQLASRHAARVAQNAEYRQLQEDLAELEALRKRETISLNEAERRKERDRQQARVKARDKVAMGAQASLNDDGLQLGERKLEEEIAAEAARKAAKDVLLEEAAHVLGDLVDITAAERNLAGGSARKAGAAVN